MPSFFQGIIFHRENKGESYANFKAWGVKPHGQRHFQTT